MSPQRIETIIVQDPARAARLGIGRRARRRAVRVGAAQTAATWSVFAEIDEAFTPNRRFLL